MLVTNPPSALIRLADLAKQCDRGHVSASQFALLVTAGIAAGLAGSIAGLASLFSNPALLAAGLPATAANVTNTVSLAVSNIGSVHGSRPELVGQAATARRLGVICAVGGAAGAALLLATPPGVFQRIVPFLVGGAAVVMLVRRPAPDALAGPASDTSDRRRRLTLVGVAAVAVYGGYFGAAAGCADARAAARHDTGQPDPGQRTQGRPARTGQHHRRSRVRGVRPGLVVDRPPVDHRAIAWFASRPRRGPPTYCGSGSRSPGSYSRSSSDGTSCAPISRSDTDPVFTQGHRGRAKRVSLSPGGQEGLSVGALGAYGRHSPQQRCEEVRAMMSLRGTDGCATNCGCSTPA